MEETKETKGTKKVTKKTNTTKKATTTAKSTQKKATTTPKTTTKKVVEVKTEEKEKLNNDMDIQFSNQEIHAFSVISFILGIASLTAWINPILGVSIAIPGFVVGLLSRASTKSSSSLLGTIMSLIGIILSIINYIA